jgi:single-strand DNA-binding protein
MSNAFRGRGNLAAAPTLTHRTVNGEPRPVADLRVYFDRPVPDGEDGFTDRGGFWLNVSLWGARAETAARVLTKGARVAAEGHLVQHAWTDEASGEARARLELRAERVDLDLVCVEQVTYRAKGQPSEDDRDASA